MEGIIEVKRFKERKIMKGIIEVKRFDDWTGEVLLFKSDVWTMVVTAFQMGQIRLDLKDVKLFLDGKEIPLPKYFKEPI